MKCPKCGSERVTVSVINEVHLVDKHHGLVWWLLVGWWWIAVKSTFYPPQCISRLTEQQYRGIMAATNEQ